MKFTVNCDTFVVAFFLNLGETHKKPRGKHHIDTYHNQDQVGMFDKHSLTLNMSDKLLSS